MTKRKNRYAIAVPSHLAKGTYQQGLMLSEAYWSGADLCGKARYWAFKYHQSRCSLMNNIADWARKKGLGSLIVGGSGGQTPSDPSIIGHGPKLLVLVSATRQKYSHPGRDYIVRCVIGFGQSRDTVGVGDIIRYVDVGRHCNPDYIRVGRNGRIWCRFRNMTDLEIIAEKLNEYRELNEKDT